MILSGDRMLLQHPAPQHWFTLTWVQAETDADDLKMEIWGVKIRWKMNFPMWLYLFIKNWWVVFIPGYSFEKQNLMS